MKLYAYYFPNWHQDPKNDKWHGTEWTEGNYLEPCEEFGYGMLEAVKKFTDEIK